MLPFCRPFTPGLLCLVMAVGVISFGCREPSKEAPILVPVSGKVTLDGAPLTTGNIMFTPESGDKNRVSLAHIDNAGAFELRTAGAAGALVGRYKVTVFEGRPGSKKESFIPSKYSLPEETPLVIEIVANPQPGAYDLILSRQ